MTVSLSSMPDGVLRSAFLHERRIPTHDAGSYDDHLDTWRTDMLVGEDTFAARVARDGLSLAEFGALISHPSPLIAPTPAFDAWVRDLSFLCSILDERTDLALPPDLTSTAPTASLFWPFLTPFLQLAWARLMERRQQHGLTRPIAAQVERDLIHALAVRLVPRCTPTLVLELNVARVRGLLTGQDGGERFRYYVNESLRQPQAWRDLIAEYPLLYRLLLISVDYWVDASYALLERVERDAAQLDAAFGAPGDFSDLTAIKTGLSDPHRRGQTVALLTFASGKRVVYKPRSLAVDLRFTELVALLNDAGLPQPLTVARALDRGEYGWVEFVEHLPCENRDDLRVFYRRLGSLVAVSHVLCGVDFHYENLIACGTQPVLVDFEGLFHPRWTRRKGDTGFVRAQQFLEASVIGTGLLPHATAVLQQKLDLSAVGGKPGQVWPRLVPLLQASATDEMHIHLGHTMIKTAANRPWLRDAPDAEIDASDYVDDIVGGFEEASDAIQRVHDQVDGMLDRFAEVEVRHIPRPTARYGVFLREGWHPDYLRDAMARDRLLDKLWAEAELKVDLTPLVPSEQADLRVGDIPFFTTRPDARAVWNSRHEPIENFFDEPALTVARRRLASITPEERQRQARLIRQAVLSVRGETANAASAPIARDATPASADELIAAASVVGEHLKAQAILGADDACWIGPVMQRSDHWEWRLAPLNTNIYEGMGGLALLFTQLAHVTGRADFDDLAMRATRPIRQHILDHYEPGAISIGAFAGCASLAYTLAVVARVRGDAELLAHAVEGLLTMEKHIPVDPELDVIGGSAGCALVALRLHRYLPDPRLLTLAARCGERLVERAAEQARGVGWVGLVSDEPLAGFAHGMSGIAWALFELEQTFGDPRYGALAMRGLEYERSLFNPESLRWKDVRFGSRTATAPAWCHGAAGVALGRVLSLRQRDDEQMREELAAAVNQTLAHGFAANHCLCHGGLGNAEIVLLAADVAQDETWRAAALAGAGEICRAVARGDWRCGLPGKVESPGFMAGLSGVGYGLLRVALRDRIAGPLSLELP